MSSTLSVKVKMSMRDFELDVVVEAAPGVTVLFGPSGAGKSCTLACIAGITRPTSGRIALGDDVWFDGARSMPIEKRRVAYVFQSLALFPHLTARDNVAYGVAGGTSEEKLGRAYAMLERMKVAHLAMRKPPTFSGGEAQRVALARAFAMTPRAILLDEPFSALDGATKKSLLEEVATHLETAKVPTILVTHDTTEARALGERVFFIEKGKIARSSSIADAGF